MSARTDLRPLVEKLGGDLGTSPAFAERLRGQLGVAKHRFRFPTWRRSRCFLLRGDEVLAQLQAMDRELYQTRVALAEQEELITAPKNSGHRSSSSSSRAPAGRQSLPSRAIDRWRCIAIWWRCTGLAAIVWMRCLVPRRRPKKSQLDGLSQKRAQVGKGSPSRVAAMIRSTGLRVPGGCMPSCSGSTVPVSASLAAAFTAPAQLLTSF